MGLVKGRGEDNHTYEVYFKPFRGTTKREKIYDKPDKELALHTCTSNSLYKCNKLGMIL
jgi:hypothetical protein